MSDDQQKKTSLSRRGFLKGVIITASNIPVVAAGCSPTEQQPLPNTGLQASPPPLNPDVPLAPNTPPNASMLRTFSVHEARTVEAMG